MWGPGEGCGQGGGGGAMALVRVGRSGGRTWLGWGCGPREPDISYLGERREGSFICVSNLYGGPIYPVCALLILGSLHLLCASELHLPQIGAQQACQTNTFGTAAAYCVDKQINQFDEASQESQMKGPRPNMEGSAEA